MESPSPLEKLRRELALAVGEPALAHKLSRNARALAERCDWSLVLSEWEHLLEDLGHRG